MAEASAEASSVSYEDLAVLEDEFTEIDLEIMRKQYSLSASAYTKRTEAISRIPNFWPLVLEQAPEEVEQMIQPQDSRIFAESLVNIEVRRPELDSDGIAGEPRSIRFKFAFRPNDDFEDTVLEKTLHYRRSTDGWSGLVSEPVKIRWKKSKDLTNGLTDGALALFEARKRTGDMTAKGLPEYTSLRKKVESWNGMNTSFFTWFGWVSQYRWVSPEESAEATEKYNAAVAKRRAGEKADFPEERDEEEDNDDDDEAVEVHQAGEVLAQALAEDLWPNAIKFFTQAQEMEDLSDVDFEDDDMDEEEDVDGGDEEPVDIRSLVQDKGSKSRSRDSGGPPSKKVKK